MNARTHTLPAGSINASFKSVPAPDLMAIIDKTCPGKDGVSILYSLTGTLDFRIARLASMITNSMAAHIRAGDTDHAAVDKYNDAMASIEIAETRVWAFEQAGISQRDMMQDLKDLVNFRLTAIEAQVKASGKPAQSRWNDTIEKAATPQAVEDWKLEMSWSEYVEGCHGKTEMSEEEFKKMKSLELTGAKQNWADYASQIISVIEMVEDEPINFDDMSVDLQKGILTGISSPEKEAKFRTGAMKIARTPEDLHTRRMFISSFSCTAREALTHPRFADKGEVIGLKEQNAAYAARRINETAMNAHNDDFMEA